MILFLVHKRPGYSWLASDSRDVVVVLADDREGAKRAAHPHLLSNPDDYVVVPSSRAGDRLTFAIAGAWIQT